MFSCKFSNLLISMGLKVRPLTELTENLIRLHGGRCGGAVVFGFSEP